MAREGLGIVGAVIGGYYFNNPQLGYAIGSSIGALIEGPAKVKLPGLSEAPIQTSRDGLPIPIGWNIVHLHGNLIQKNNPLTIIVRESTGKGGGTVTSSERRTQTFAIGLARSPVGVIDGISRIWQYDKLIYDTRQNPNISPAETARTAASIRIYTGDESQLPDPDLEAFTGIGLTPAYRGLPYVVFVDWDITDFGSAIPLYRFELNAAGADLTVTSRPYPIELIEGIDSSFSQSDFDFWYLEPEGFDSHFTMTGISIIAPLVEYTIEPEGFDSSFTLGAITLLNQLVEYSYVEGFDSSFTLTDVLLEPRLVQYTIAPEGFDSSFICTGIIVA